MSLADIARRHGGGPSPYTAQQIMDLDSSEPTSIVPGFISQRVTHYEHKWNEARELGSVEVYFSEWVVD